MRNQLERCILGIDVDVVIHLVGHFGHLLAGGYSLAADQQLGSIDVNDLINPWRGAAEESLSNRTKNRFVGSGEGVLPRLVNIQYRAARFQYAEVITLNREQRTGNDAFVCNLDGQALGSEHVRAIRENGCDNLPCDRHNLHSASAPGYAHRGFVNVKAYAEETCPGSTAALLGVAFSCCCNSASRKRSAFVSNLCTRSISCARRRSKSSRRGSREVSASLIWWSW